MNVTEVTVRTPARRGYGFSLVEVLVALAIGGILILGTVGLLEQVGAVQRATQEREELVSTARFAMQRMVLSISRGRRLLLPLADRDDTDWRENVREQTVPPSPPEGSSTFATAILAVTLDSAVDLDGNGIADADNDLDGRIDEDLPGDTTNDGEPGLIGVDDNGNGQVDDGLFNSRPTTSTNPKTSPRFSDDGSHRRRRTYDRRGQHRRRLAGRYEQRQRPGRRRRG